MLLSWLKHVRRSEYVIHVPIEFAPRARFFPPLQGSMHVEEQKKDVEEISGKRARVMKTLEEMA